MRPYKKPRVFAKQGVYKMMRVTLLQKGGPTTNFSYKKNIPRPFYTVHVFSLFVVEIPSGIDLEDLWKKMQITVQHVVWIVFLGIGVVAV